VDEARREAIRRHHTATHLLHAALRGVLGPHATQKGSRVAPEQLRFDFAHFEPLTPEQIVEIERLVARSVVENRPVSTTPTTLEEAKDGGAMTIFEETYGDVVRLVEVSGVSRELCGGTHVDRSGDIGPFFVVSETGIAAGVRRMEAVAGIPALEWAISQREAIEWAAGLLKSNPAGLVDRVEKLLARERELGREVERLKRRIAEGGAGSAERVEEIDGTKVVSARVDVGDPGALRDAADAVRRRIGSGVVCLGGEHDGKAALVVAVTEDLSGRLDAREMIKDVAALVGGRGGGRPDLSQAGGPDVNGLDEAVGSIFEAVSKASRASARDT